MGCGERGIADVCVKREIADGMRYCGLGHSRNGSGFIGDFFWFGLSVLGDRSF